MLAGPVLFLIDNETKGEISIPESDEYRTAGNVLPCLELNPPTDSIPRQDCLVAQPGTRSAGRFLVNLINPGVQ